MPLRSFSYFQIANQIQIFINNSQQHKNLNPWLMKNLFSKSFTQRNDLLQSNLQNTKTLKQYSENQKYKTKKMFSRKPETTNKTNLNSSKIGPSKVKQKVQDVPTSIEQYSGEIRLKNLLTQSMNLKFVSYKNSESLQKLFMSQSMQQLHHPQIQKKVKKSCGVQNFNIGKNNKARSLSSTNLKISLKVNQQPLQTIIDSQEYYIEDGLKKRSHQYLAEKDDYTNCHQTTQESPRGTQSGVFDFSNSDIMFSRVCEKQCIQCQNLKDQIKILTQKNNILQNNLVNKQRQFYQLEIKIQNFSGIIKQIEGTKTKIQQELKQKQFNFLAQKDAIERQLKIMKCSYNKAVQDLKYKQIQNNINKRYRKEYSDISLKLKDLEQKLQQSKLKVKYYKQKVYICEKCQDLKRNESHPNLSIKHKRGGSIKKDQKRQKGVHTIQKRYSQDTVFSLSLTSEQQD